MKFYSWNYPFNLNFEKKLRYLLEVETPKLPEKNFIPPSEYLQTYFCWGEKWNRNFAEDNLVTMNRAERFLKIKEC